MDPIKFNIDNITEFEYFGSKIIKLETKGFFQLPFEIDPTKGKHDYNSCEECQKSITTITNALTGKFNGNKEKNEFPLCCSAHPNLLKLEGFKRELFAQVPAMVARKVVYTKQHITNNIDLGNWHKSITDYLEWVIESFGQMPSDCGERLFLSDYYHYISEALKEVKDIDSNKKDALLKFIAVYQEPNNNSKSDFITLVNTYQTWIKEFPFELNNYFGNQKKEFINHLPIIDGELEINMFSGKAKVKMHTQSSLIMVLVNLTKQLLNTIDAKHLIEKGLIADYNKHQFELYTKSLQTATSIITQNFSVGELEYVEAINKWLELHKNYFKDIAPLLHSVTPQKISQDIEESNQYIKPELYERLLEVEGKMQPTINTFQQSKIKCAAWVELLMDRKYFILELTKSKRKSSIGFAKKRYGINITTQMNTGNKNDRATHKKQLSKHLR